jgi:hypothetical protein
MEIPGVIVEFNLSGHRAEGVLRKANYHTCIVKVRRAGKTFVIKRHIDKHKCKIVDMM